MPLDTKISLLVQWNLCTAGKFSPSEGDCIVILPCDGRLELLYVKRKEILSLFVKKTGSAVIVCEKERKCCHSALEYEKEKYCHCTLVCEKKLIAVIVHFSVTKKKRSNVSVHLSVS